MAYQHLYSRVPAKMSLFNKTDGYDTFAHSEDLSFETIDKELSRVYENKPTKNDALLIQNGTLPPLYCQFCTAEGQLVQSCMSFMPLDYTGERSAYLVHSLVFTDEERALLLESPDNAPLNPAMFRRDISGFDMTSFDSHPDSAFPTLDYEPLRSPDTMMLVKQYDLGMMKRFIFALLSVAAGKMKTIYLTLPYSFDNFSEQSLLFLNTVMQIVPYHMRSALSFVTYVSDYTKFNSFKIKCQPNNAPPVPIAKGVTIRFGARDAVGVGDELIAQNGNLVDFFYGLLSNDALRREFLIFCDRAVHAMPTLAKPSLSNISDLVFLFRQCSGYFNEAGVLPNDDAVYSFVCTYEKYRTAISDDYRAEALKCLWRYPNNHTAIPKNVLSKVSKIYPTETVASRRTVMNVVLELIHTDVMRDKLFTFISNNYEAEDPGVRRTIMQDLSRVYYGGFLQVPLAEFFIRFYDSEPEDTQDLIVEKFLLTIRTEAIQPLVIDFFDQHYMTLSAEQKRRFYTTFFEMIGEGDALAEKLIRMVDTHVAEEDDAFRSELEERLSDAMQSDMKRKQPRLLPALARTPGFCRTSVVGRIFSVWTTRKVFGEYVAMLSALPVSDRIAALLDVFRTVPDISSEICGQLSDALTPSLSEDAGKEDVFTLIDTDARLAAFIAEGENKDAAALCQSLRENAIQPAICTTLPGAFSYRRRPDGLETVRDYAKANKFVASSPEYDAVCAYYDIVDAALADGIGKIMTSCEKLTDKFVRTGAADHLQAELIDQKRLDDEQHDGTKLLVSMLITFFKTGTPSATPAYNALVDAIKARFAASAAGKPNPEADRQRAEETAIKTLLTLGGEACQSGASEETVAQFFGAGTDSAQIVQSFLRKYDKKGKRYVTALLPSTPANGTAFGNTVLKLVATTQAPSGNFLTKLFKK